MRKIKYVLDTVKLVLAYCISIILRISKKNRDIWLVGERRNEAKDNGYHLFRYIRENHDKEKVYYVIGRESKDLDKLQPLGNIIYADSFKHYLYYAMASKLVMAHLSSCVPDSPICWKAKDLGIVKYKKIFIQHGITKELIPSLMYENTKADLFICGAKPEYKFVKSEFGYPEGSVKYTGFARFDNLHDFKEKNQILVMPTWRQWITSYTWQSESTDECRDIFLDSDYYKKYNSLINNKDLIELLDKYDIELIFYPHYEMQGYIDLFKTKSRKIVISRKDEYDVQQLLKESKVLITDYSSVAFDFAYMRKPIMYYQFDFERYNENHYSKGYFNYHKNGFGIVIDNLDKLIVEIENIVCNSDNTNKFNNRCIEFFELNDVSNSKRNFESIKNM